MLTAMHAPFLALLVLPVAILAMSCASAERSHDLGPASIGPELKNNLNAPHIARNASGVLGTIQRLDPALDALLAPDAKVEILVDGVDWAEGPVWYRGGLFFSDVKQNVLYRWTPEHGVRPYLKPSGYTAKTPRGGEPGSNGLTIDPQGRLTLCQHGDRRVVRLEPDGHTLAIMAERYMGMRFSSPNDLCYDSRGNLYFTDPPYGLVGMDKDPAKEMDANGVYLRRVTGQLLRLDTREIVYADGTRVPLNFPNGVAFSPDEKHLYVCVSDPIHPVYMRYDVQPDGTINNGRVFFDAKPLVDKGLLGLPDGIKSDSSGNVWAGGPGGILIFSPRGKHLGTLLTGVQTANLNWGGDGSVLYICANHNVCRIQTKTKGLVPGRSDGVRGQ